MTDIVERLQKATLYEGNGELSALPEEAADEIAALRAENERLRAALELFACDCIDSGNLCPSPQNCRNYIARAALEEKPNDKA